MRFYQATLLILLLSRCNDYKLTEDVKPNQYVWFTEAMAYKGTFDTTLYSVEEIKSAQILVQSFEKRFREFNSGYAEDFFDSIGRKEQAENDLYNAYTLRKQEISKLTIIKKTSWQNLKGRKLYELEEEYEIRKKIICALIKPEILEDSSFSKGSNFYIAIAKLNDTTELLERWEYYLKDGEKGEEELKEFNSKYQTRRDRFLNARAKIIIWEVLSKTIKERRNKPSVGMAFENLFTKIESERDY